MAPRPTKAKKAMDVKVAEGDAPKKVRKAKAIAEAEEPEVEDKMDNMIEKKNTKRGKKEKADGHESTNGVKEEIAPPSKKSKKKNIAPQEEKVIENDNGNVEPQSSDGIEDTDQVETKDSLEESLKADKGGKKQVKKVTVKTNGVDASSSKESIKSKKSTKKDTELKEEKMPNVIKSAGQDENKHQSGKGRGRKPKVEKDIESENHSDLQDKIHNLEPAIAKGQKKVKASKEKINEAPLEEIEPEEKSAAKKGRKGKKIATKVIDDQPDEDPPAPKKRKVTKKGTGKGDAKEVSEDVELKPAKGKRGQKKAEIPEEPEEEFGEVEDLENEAPEVKMGKGKRGQKKIDTAEAEEEDESGDPASKRRRKPTDEKVSVDDTKKKAPPKNKALTTYEDIDFSNRSKSGQGKEWNFKISCWNVDGIRAWMGKGGLDFIKYEKPDILCLQEIKCSQDKFPEEIANLPGYHAYWLSGDKDGYAGVGIYTTKLAINVEYGLGNEELDSEGRIITAEYEEFYLICTYVPNAGRKLVTLPKRLQWNEEFRKYVKELDKKKPVIICGDMNVAHNEIDLANPKTNKKNAGFTEEERSGMTELLSDGFVDTFRHLYPDKTGAYTFWTYMMNSRAKNVGWRLDYFIVSERFLSAVCDNVIRDGVYGSDHCPISLFLQLTSADQPKE